MELQKFRVVGGDSAYNLNIGDTFTIEGVYSGRPPRSVRVKRSIRQRYWKMRYSVGDMIQRLANRINGVDDYDF